jgi:NAD-dependent dihydropyrimidine dehydrogenase PreA subunit
MIKIKVEDNCTGCGICVKKCPTEVLELKDNRSSMKDIDACMVCRLCEVVCPEKGISVIEE